MNVLSLFDGISCGQVALERSGIKVDTYFASEVDKRAMSITRKNYPNTIFIGDVTKVSYKDGILKTENGDFKVKIDLVMGGSPCQSFSVSGKRTGFDGSSKLYWEYSRILKETKPTWFLLENVVMKEEWAKVITNDLQVYPIIINSNKLSAQNRKRMYWSNFGGNQPKNKGLLLRDVLELDVHEKYYLSEKCLLSFLKKTQRGYEKGNGFTFQCLLGEDKSPCLTTKIGQRLTDTFILDTKRMKNLTPKNASQGARVYDINGKSISMVSNGGGHGAKTGLYFIPYALASARTPFAKLERKLTKTNKQQDKQLIPRTDGKFNAILTTPNSSEGLLSDLKGRVRRLTPLEAERLQTLSDNYTKIGIDDQGKEYQLSDTARYHGIGNGWTVDVIAHIFSFIKNNKIKKLNDIVRMESLF